MFLNNEFPLKHPNTSRFMGHVPDEPAGSSGLGIRVRGRGKGRGQMGKLFVSNPNPNPWIRRFHC